MVGINSPVEKTKVVCLKRRYYCFYRVGMFYAL